MSQSWRCWFSQSVCFWGFGATRLFEIFPVELMKKRGGMRWRWQQRTWNPCSACSHFNRVFWWKELLWLYRFFCCCCCWINAVVLAEFQPCVSEQCRSVLLYKNFHRKLLHMHDGGQFLCALFSDVRSLKYEVGKNIAFFMVKRCCIFLLIQALSGSHRKHKIQLLI